MNNEVVNETCSLAIAHVVLPRVNISKVVTKHFQIPNYRVPFHPLPPCEGKREPLSGELYTSVFF